MDDVDFVEKRSVRDQNHDFLSCANLTHAEFVHMHVKLLNSGRNFKCDLVNVCTNVIRVCISSPFYAHVKSGERQITLILHHLSIAVSEMKLPLVKKGILLPW